MPLGVSISPPPSLTCTVHTHVNMYIYTHIHTLLCPLYIPLEDVIVDTVVLVSYNIDHTYTHCIAVSSNMCTHSQTRMEFWLVQVATNCCCSFDPTAAWSLTSYRTCFDLTWQCCTLQSVWIGNTIASSILTLEVGLPYIWTLLEYDNAFFIA